MASAAPVATAAPASGLPELRDFEGEIGWLAKTELPGKSRDPLSLTLLVKSGNFRIDAPAGMPGLESMGKVYVLGKTKSKEFMAVLEGQKQVVKIDAQKMAAQADALAAKHKSAPGAVDAPKPELKKTGKLDKVAGYSCEIWQVTDRTSSTELCVASEAAPWFGDAIPKLPSDYGWATELMDGKHFPLRVVSFKGKTESLRLELTRIEKKTLDAALFEPPAGYRVLNLEQMLQGMMMGMMGTPGLSGAHGGANLPSTLPPPLPSPQPKKPTK